MVCDFEKLWLYLSNKLSPNDQLKVLEHLAHCEICVEAANQIARDRNADPFARLKTKGSFADQ